MTEITTIGLDLAKRVFQVRGADAARAVMLRRQLERRQIKPFFAKRPGCLIGIEACGTAHHWVRRLGQLGALSAALALLTGVLTVEAGELSDPRNNRLLLQQPIEQLPAPAPPQTAPGAAAPDGSAATPDRPATGGSFPRSFLIPGTDTSIRIGGSVDGTLDRRTPR